MITPDRNTFLERLRAGFVASVSTTIPGDMLTPVGAYLSLADAANGSFLLESVEGGEHLARYSFLGFDATTILESRGNTTTLRRRSGGTTPGGLPSDGNIFDAASTLLGSIRIHPGDELPRLAAGLVGFIGYDEVRAIERIPCSVSDELGAPDSLLGYFGTLVVFDHVTHSVRLFVNADPFDERSPGDLYEELVERLGRLRGALRIGAGGRTGGGYCAGEARFDLSAFPAKVERVKEYIRAGDIFQVVLSERARVGFEGDPFQVYRALRMLNPSPYHFFMDFGGTVLLGSSPETLARLHGGLLEHVPIAGTRPRGRTAGEDDRIAAELLADEKERSEHVMLVDLGRNDLSRVCRQGSVVVDRLMQVERFSHVMHLVSRVSGTVLPGTGPVDALKALFPAGTVSGAPKIRAMEIIDEMERIRRGFYAGAVGYFDGSGNMDFCLAIRTMLAFGGEFHLQAGAGIVSASDPLRETEELRHKLLALFEAVRSANEVDG